MTGLPDRLRPPEDGVWWIAASGLLLGAAHPPFHLLVPSFVALVPFLVWVGRLPAGPEGRSRALRGGFYLGLLYFTLVFYWLVVALIYYTPLAILAFLFPVLIMSGFLALATLGMQQTVRRLGAPLWLAAPVFWTASEWARGHLGPVSFPWMELGATLSGYPRLVGAADLVGTRGMSFWLVLVNALLAVAWLRWRRDRAGEAGNEAVNDAGREAGEGSAGGERTGVDRAWVRLRVPLAGLLIALVLPIVYSLHRWQTVEMEPAARVAVVQPNIPEDLKLQSSRAADSARAASEALLRRPEIGGGRLDLVILPETVFPLFVDPIPSAGYRGQPAVRRWASRTARRLDAALLYGGIGSEDLGDGEFDYYNSAFLLDSTGTRVARYDKRNLVPVVERVPFVDPDWFRMVNYFGGYGVGERRGAMHAAGTRFGVLICYESIFARQSRRYRRDGAEFVVNMTNDAWFGRHEPWWSRTSALWQHPAHLVMRAVENRMGVARSANTGISGLVDPLGRFHRRTELFRPASFAGTVYTSSEVTLFTRWGDWLGTGAAVAALLGIVASGWMRRRPTGAGTGPAAGRNGD